MRDNPYRLPRTASPSRYDLVLEPDLVAATFAGTVDVALDVHEGTDELVCNAAELEIDQAWVTTADGRRIDVVAKPDEATERLHLGTRSALDPGAATLHLEFRGTLNDKLRGFYRSTYADDAGVERVIATTQMESTDCRRAFPCWDEPDFKAVFGITLVVPAGLSAVSNAPETDRQTADGADGRVRISFADTMVMSTYLVAFVVGPLEATDPVDVDGIPLRVVHVPGKENLTAFALEVGAFSLRWFQDYYGIRYPEQKCDLVALPDFAFGAMENPGCITFRETALLVDPATATQQDRQRIADVVSHELAHMWFGDLVTMKWWNGIWLNEAFATFMATLACDAFRPDWRRWTTFSLERTAAFEVDALHSTRSIEYEVVSPADADGMFDVLTYEKGGSLLRMLEQYLGADRFRDGIRRYLTTHAYGNTETSDLWDAIEAATDEPVRRVMDSWIWQGGYPLVSAAVVGDDLRLSQRRFLFAGDDDGSRWVVPLHLRQPSGADTGEKLLLDGEETVTPLAAPDGAVVVNADANGFFRVEYDADLLHRLAGPALAELTTAERYTLVDDAWASVVAGRLDAEAYCRFVRGFADEPDLPVWEILLAGLAWIDRFVDGEPRERFRAYVRALVAPALERLGWEPAAGEDELTGELRGTLIRALGVLGRDPVAVERARALHARSVADPTAVPPAVAAAALSVVAATGDEADYEAGLNRYRRARTPQDQRRELFALAEFEPEALLRRTLDLAFSDDVKTQDAPFLLGRCIAHRRHGALAWRFVREHWDEASRRFPVNLMIRIIEPITRLTKPEEAADVQAFLAEHPLPQAGKRVEQVLERQSVNVALRQREEPALTHAFE